MLTLPHELYPRLILSPVELAQVRKTCRRLRLVPNPFEYYINGAAVTLGAFLTSVLTCEYVATRQIRSLYYEYTQHVRGGGGGGVGASSAIEYYTANNATITVTRNYADGQYLARNSYLDKLVDVVGVRELWWLRRIFAVPSPAALYRVKYVHAPLWPDRHRRDFAAASEDKSDIVWFRGTFTYESVTVELRRHSIILHTPHYRPKRTVYAESAAGTVYINGAFYNGSHREAAFLAGLCDVFLIKERVV